MLPWSQTRRPTFCNLLSEEECGGQPSRLDTQHSDYQLYLLSEEECGVHVAMIGHDIEGGRSHLVELTINVDEMNKARKVIQISAGGYGSARSR